MSIEKLDVIDPPRRQKLYVPIGWPGSGKSTRFLQMRTENPRLARVSRDDARATMFNEQGKLSFEQEEVISKAERAQAKALLGAGFDVYVDAMNLRQKWVRRWADLAALNGADIEAIYMDATVDECVARDKARGEAGGRSVGEQAIRDLAKRFPRKAWPKVKASPDLLFYPQPYVPDETLHPAWICDIDGTVARMADRNPYDFTRVNEDEPIEHTVKILRKLAGDSVILMLSGRDDDCRDVTEEWLRANKIPCDALFMRAAGDKRPDYLVKAELFDRHIRHRNRVLGVFDDRLSVCRMWSRMGLPLMRLGKPDEDDF